MLNGMKTLALFVLSAALAMAADISGKWTFNVVLVDYGEMGKGTFDGSKN